MFDGWLYNCCPSCRPCRLSPCGDCNRPQLPALLRFRVNPENCLRSADRECQHAHVSLVPPHNSYQFCKHEIHSQPLQKQTLNCFQTIICNPENGKLACPFYSLYPVREPKRFYDLNIPLAKCKNNIPAQRILRTYDTYAL